ncbi:tripartite tricarboxylate transporter substrate binding protein [Xylophilus sp. GOD-11R]|uniref:Bug family tripartite tricarboxylate transporter substrate binding protein n=1 Tax=Xylophilus sp. GOD-11R TaxID=3089814 RepID=UPI00298C3371|nr:tripartite tricarboxylate transporter substrate binding protein [Xylophilus sp. GOD-11R]WPB55459.1 tripartite tricarboxylate transporter substrate binding protein [Xylophilus sp. GOD-11R]
MNFLKTACAAALLVTAGIAGAQAPAYPSKPIKLIVPYAAGGASDLSARWLADGLTQRFKYTIVIENHPGAAGNIGTRMVAKAAPDGYTLLLGYDGTLTINPWVYPNVGFDTLKDFVPVSKIDDSTLLLVANNDLPAKNVKELIALAKAKPGTLDYATTGIGSTPHVAGEMMNLQFGIDLRHIPYAGGAPAMTAVMGDHVKMVYTAVGTAVTFVQAGKVKALGVSAPKRSAALPDVPTFSELGVPGFDLNSWFGILAPAGTPKDIVDQLQRNIREVVQSPGYRERYIAAGLEPVGNTSEEFGAQIKADLARWGDIVKKAKVTAQ